MIWIFAMCVAIEALNLILKGRPTWEDKDD